MTGAIAQQCKNCSECSYSLNCPLLPCTPDSTGTQKAGAAFIPAMELRPAARIECAKILKPIVRIGWGDMMFESAAWYANATNYNYRYLGHFFGEFQYPVLNWLGVGFKADWSKVSWDMADRKAHNFHNICLMPELRFTYFRRGRVEMYSGLGFGLNVNTGTELDWKGRTTACAPVLDLTLYGISVGCEHWFASFDIGGLNSFMSIKKELYMLGSRIFSISIGYRL